MGVDMDSDVGSDPADVVDSWEEEVEREEQEREQAKQQEVDQASKVAKANGDVTTATAE
jgi:RecA/RadA recombinase